MGFAVWWRYYSRRDIGISSTSYVLTLFCSETREIDAHLLFERIGLYHYYYRSRQKEEGRFYAQLWIVGVVDRRPRMLSHWRPIVVLGRLTCVPNISFFTLSK